MVIWLIGLSGSGKTTIGRALYDRLKPQHQNLVFVDGDEFRAIMGNDLGFSYEDRMKNAERFSKFCHFLDRQGIHLVCAVLSNFPQWQKWNRDTFGQYFEVHVDVSIDVLARRDFKGLYKEALAGRKTNVVGVDIPFTAPPLADLVIDNNIDLDDAFAHTETILNALPDFWSAR